MTSGSRSASASPTAADRRSKASTCAKSSGSSKALEAPCWRSSPRRRSRTRRRRSDIIASAVTSVVNAVAESRPHLDGRAAHRDHAVLLLQPERHAIGAFGPEDVLDGVAALDLALAGL